MYTTSATLLERLRAPGDDRAWERFVELYRPLLLYWARKAGLGEADAADLVQDVFASLVKSLPQFRYDAGKGFRCWLRTVLHNRYRDELRRRAARPAAAAPGSWSDVPSPDPDPAVELEEAEYREHLVRRCLELVRGEFHPTTWSACWEHVVNGRPAAEVAAGLGVTVNAVYIAKSRVLRRLHAELAGLLDEG